MGTVLIVALFILFSSALGYALVKEIRNEQNQIEQ